jgi:hypothetical protein
MKLLARISALSCIQPSQLGWLVAAIMPGLLAGMLLLSCRAPLDGDLPPLESSETATTEPTSFSDGSINNGDKLSLEIVEPEMNPTTKQMETTAPGVRILGQLNDPDGNPLPKTKVTFSQGTSSNQTTTETETDNAGRFCTAYSLQLGEESKDRKNFVVVTTKSQEYRNTSTDLIILQQPTSWSEEMGTLKNLAVLANSANCQGQDAKTCPLNAFDSSTSTFYATDYCANVVDDACRTEFKKYNNKWVTIKLANSTAQTEDPSQYTFYRIINRWGDCVATQYSIAISSFSNPGCPTDDNLTSETNPQGKWTEIFTYPPTPDKQFQRNETEKIDDIIFYQGTNIAEITTKWIAIILKRGEERCNGTSTNTTTAACKDDPSGFRYDIREFEIYGNRAKTDWQCPIP